MTEYQRLFLVQARTDFAVFLLLQKQTKLSACHALHYLQMATELLGKAHHWKHGPRPETHRAFVSFIRSLASNRKAQKRMGFQGQNANWEQLIRQSLPLAEQVEELAPALAGEGPNPEYPWPSKAPITAPAEFAFEIWPQLRITPAGRKFLSLAQGLFAEAEAYL